MDWLSKVVGAGVIIGEGVSAFRRARAARRGRPQDIQAPKPAEEAFRAMLKRMESDRKARNEPLL